MPDTSSPRSAPPKSFFLDPDLHGYILSHGGGPDEAQQALIAATQALGPVARMQIAPEQGVFMEWLARVTGARQAVEVGVFTGYSALCLARGLGSGGRLLCLDVNEEWTRIARTHWRRAGLADRITLRLGPAAATLATLPRQPTFDLGFIDADKENGRLYYEEVLARLRPGGILMLDNVFWGGKVAAPRQHPEDTALQTICELNDFAAADPRVQASLLPLGDGLLLLRKR
ncbi:MAG: O-methyltransferase [Cyanobacteria bacterium MAG CAR1_bin_15]|nr:O-methyltransferase [Cyanobacteria bacterium MAG CAR1_bin_15]